MYVNKTNDDKIGKKVTNMHNVYLRSYVTDEGHRCYRTFYFFIKLLINSPEYPNLVNSQL